MKTNRRNFLRGMGVAFALPVFESVVNQKAIGATNPLSREVATTETGAPLRMAYLYSPNGVNVSKWNPKGEGTDYELNETQKPYEKFKNDFQIFSGFELANGWAGSDGAGDHARALATFLTTMRPRKTSGADIKVGVSVDQVAAQNVGYTTRFPSLELSCDGARKSGSCDSGYSCAYQFNLAWKSSNTPLAPERNPRLVFERLFAGGSGKDRQKNLEQRTKEKRSLIDFALDDATSLRKQLGKNDQQKLDEYLSGVRDIEKRIERAEKMGPPKKPNMAQPTGIPKSYQDHIRLMMDMMLVAFETDSTRIATFMLAHDGSNRSFREIGVPDGHHAISHHGDKPDKLEKIAKIDKFYAEQFAYFMEQMESKKDFDGNSILHNSMVLFGSGLSDPNRHRHNNLPIVLAGHGGGTLNPGRHVKLNGDTPLANLYLHMLEKMGVKETRFGDSSENFTNV